MKYVTLIVLGVSLWATLSLWGKSRFQDNLLKAVKGDSEQVHDIEFSPDGKWVFTAGNDGLKQWDTKSFELIAHFDIKIDVATEVSAIDSIAIAKAQPIIFVGTIEQDVIAWNYSSKSIVGKIPTRERWAKWVSTIAINPTGTILAIAENGADKKIKPAEETDFSVLLWNIQTNKKMDRFYGHGQSVYNLEFSPDGNELLAIGENAMVFWETATGKIKRSFGNLEPKSYDSIKAESKQSLAVLAGEFVPPAQPNTEQKDFEIYTKGFLKNGLFLTGSKHGNVRIFHLPTGKLLQEFEQFSNGVAVESVAISPDGTMVVSGGNGRHYGGFGVDDDQSDRNLCFWKLK